MKPLTRDITVTLLIKFTLLILLWIVCFKHIEKPVKNTEQWLLGTNLTKDASQVKPAAQ